MSNHHKKLLFRLWLREREELTQSKLVCGSVWPKNDDDDDNDDDNNASPEDSSSPWIPLSPPRLLKVQKVD